MSSNFRIGLTLGSGAARGWTHIGIIKTLVNNGIEPQIVTGCSIGALVGAAYVAGRLEALEEWVVSLDRLEVARFFELSTGLNGFVNTDRLHDFLHRHVCDDSIKIEALDKTFAAVATDLGSGAEIWFSQGSLIEAVWASISLPGLFPAIRHKNRWLVDGGLVNPVPISTCRALGADLVIAVNLNGDIVGKHIKTQEKQIITANANGLDTQESESWFDTISRKVSDYSFGLFNSKEADDGPNLLDSIAGTVNITQDRITRFRIAADPPDILMVPKVSHIGLLEFYRAKESIEAGEALAKQMLPEIKQLLHTI